VFCAWKSRHFALDQPQLTAQRGFLAGRSSTREVEAPDGMFVKSMVAVMAASMRAPRLFEPINYATFRCSNQPLKAGP